MICRKCGFDSPSDSIFCVNCGEPLSQNQKQTASQAQPPPEDAMIPLPPVKEKRKGAVLVVFAATLALVVVGFLIWFFLSGDKKEQASAATETITKLMIVQQPTSDYAPVDSAVATTVVAVGDDLTYLWYAKEADSGVFLKSSAREATYGYTMTEEKNGRQVYCVITDKHGNSVTSETVTFGIPTPLVLTKAPTDASAFIGSGVGTTVEAQGDGLTYTWYAKEPGSDCFVKSAAREAKYSFLLTEEKVGRQVFCIITDMYGNTLGTNTVTFTAKAGVKIIQQPKDDSAPIGSGVSATVVAEGEGLTYQWYVKNPGTDSFVTSATRKDTYEFRMVSEKDGRQVYCVITDKYGNSVTSDTITFSAE